MHKQSNCSPFKGSIASLGDGVTDPAGMDLVLALLRAIDEKLDAVNERLSHTHKSHYTVEEVAAIIARSPYTVRRHIKDGEIEAIRIPGAGPKGRLLIPRDALAKLVCAGRGGSVPAALSAAAS